MPPILNTTSNYQLRVHRQGCSNNQLSYADVNGNGQYDRNQDMVIITDMNGDGRLTDSDAIQTSQLLRQIANRRSPDLNADGLVTMAEMQTARSREGMADAVDRRSDGILRGTETRPFVMARDRNNDGNYGPEMTPHQVRGVTGGSVQLWEAGVVRRGADRLMAGADRIQHAVTPNMQVSRAGYESMKRSGIIQ